MTPTFVNPPSLIRPRGYNHGVLMPVGPAAALLSVAGQIGCTSDGSMAGSTFAIQFEHAMGNVVAVVTEAGGKPDAIVKLTIFVTDKNLYQSDLAAVGRAYRRLMGKHFPAMSLVEVRALLDPAALVEIEGLAVIST